MVGLSVAIHVPILIRHVVKEKVNMHKIPKNHFIKSKVRGQKRKFRDLEQRLKELGQFFPEDNYVHDKYYHYHFPCNQGLLDSLQSTNKIRRNSLQLLINSAADLIKARPEEKKNYKIVCALTFPYVWDSQVIIFYDENYYNDFLNIKGNCQKWTEKNELAKYGLTIPEEFSDKVCIEEIDDQEDDFQMTTCYIGEITLPNNA